MIWWRLAAASAWSRRWPMTLVVAGLALACALVWSMAQLRQDARDSFSSAISGVDLIVGAQGGESDLLLYTVFHRGRASKNIATESLAAVRALPQVAWAVPIQMGDTYAGHPVVATERAWFERVRVAGQPMRMAHGRAFENDREVVLGAWVAEQQGLRLGARVALTHGEHRGALAQVHDDHLFEVVGVLAPTGTPVDNTLVVSTGGFQALHESPALGLPASSALYVPKQAPSYTALMVGLERRSAVFSARRDIEGLSGFNLMAVMPGVVLSELWRSLAVVDGALRAMAWLVVLATALSLSATLMMSLEARRREMAVLRAVGASPWGIASLLVLEAMAVFSLALLLGAALTLLGSWALADVLRGLAGIQVQWRWPTTETWLSLLALGGMALLSAGVPAWRALRLSLSDGLNPPHA